MPKNDKAVWVDFSLLLDIKKYLHKSANFKNKRQSMHGAGELKSPFKSKGLDFQEVRQYQAGDDIRQIDWRITARYNKPFTKLFTDEKQEQIIILCDLRSKMKFASKGVFKSVALAKMAAYIMFLSKHRQAHLDFVALLPNRIISSYKMPNQSKGLNLLKLLSDESNPNNMPPDTSDFTAALKQTVQLNKKGSVIFMLSDFFDISPVDESLIKQLSRHSTCHLIRIIDKLEQHLPPDILSLSNGTTTTQIDATSHYFQEQYANAYSAVSATLKSLQHNQHISGTTVHTDDNIMHRIGQYCMKGK